MIRGVHHTNFATGNLERMLWFYRDLLGLEVAWEHGWEPGTEVADTIVGMKGTSTVMAMLRAGNTYIEIIQYKTPQGQPNDPNRPTCDHGLTHVCFDVTDIHSEYERLKAAGIRFNSGPVLADRLYSLYGRDPDGNVFELQELLTEDHELQLPYVPQR